jgi:hypothetical protein
VRLTISRVQEGLTVEVDYGDKQPAYQTLTDDEIRALISMLNLAINSGKFTVSFEKETPRDKKKEK